MQCDCKSEYGYEHDEIVALCRNSLFAFAQIIGGYSFISPNLHLPVCNWFENGVRKGKRRFLVMEPREHVKSLLFTVCGSGWMLVNNPETRILIVHASAKMAKKYLRVAKAMVLSDRMRHLFPHIVPDIQKVDWTDTEATIQRDGVYPEASMTALGVTSTIVGGHFDVQIFDDLVDENISLSSAEMERVISFHDNAAPLFVNPATGLRIVVGTLWPGGFYEKLIDSKYYEKLILGCYVDPRYQKFMRGMGLPEGVLGDPIWPEQFTKESLEQIEVEMGPWLFAHQYRNELQESNMVHFEEKNDQLFRFSPGLTPLEQSVIYEEDTRFESL